MHRRGRIHGGRRSIRWVYPRHVNAKRAWPERSGDRQKTPPSGRADEKDGSAGGPFGPLAVRRLVKDDGRALIIYRRVES